LAQARKPGVQKREGRAARNIQIGKKVLDDIKSAGMMPAALHLT
jgi:hypothetical protein